MRAMCESGVEDPFAHGQEASVTLLVFRREAADLLSHQFGVARVVEHVSVVEPDAVERVHGPEIDIVPEAASAQLPQLLEQERRRDHRRPRVEREPVLLEHTGPPARLVQALQDRHPVAPHSQAHGSGQPAEAGPYYGRVWPPVFAFVQHFLASSSPLFTTCLAGTMYGRPRTARNR
jgi:hypothetical protein